MKKNMNKAIGFLAYNLGMTKVPNHPTVYSIETTNSCNLDCIMCPRRDMKRDIGFMSFKTFKKIIDETKAYSSFIWLHQMGEPLLDKNIFKFVNYCGKNGVKTGFSTNATLLNKENSKKIIGSTLGHLVISLDGITKKTYERVRRKSDFEKTKRNIKGFLKEKAKLGKGPYTVLQIIRMKETEPEIEQFKREWLNSGVDQIYVKDFCTWAGQLDTFDKISEQSQRYNRGVIFKRPPCFFLWYSLAILWDGSVIMCCRDFDGSEVLGNINEQRLEEIWNGEKMVTLRKNHLAHKFDNTLCKNCTDWPPVYRTPFLIHPKNLKIIFKKLTDFRKGM